MKKETRIAVSGEEMEKDAAEVATPDKMKVIVDLAKQLQEQIANTSAAEAAFEEEKEKLAIIQIKKLPDAMADANMKEFTLEDGTKFTVKPFYSASIKEEMKQKAFAWLRSQGHDGIIKNEIIVPLAKGENSLADAIAEFLGNADVPFTRTESVHAGTLKAFVKERAEAGDCPPADLFGIFIGKKADVAAPKKSWQ